MALNWNLSKEDTELILNITRRAIKIAYSMGCILLKGIEMDIAMVHLNGCELKLSELLVTDDSDFMHDVIGIRKHLDRKTGKLKDCFLPRFAK